MSRTDDLNRILRTMQASTPEIEASAPISEDGLMIASALPQHIDEMRVAGMSSTLVSLGTRSGTSTSRLFAVAAGGRGEGRLEPTSSLRVVR